MTAPMLLALGTMNRALGIVFGLLKYLVIVSILIYLTNSVNSRYRFIKQEAINKSLLFEPLVSVVPAIYPTIEKYIDSED